MGEHRRIEKGRFYLSGQILYVSFVQGESTGWTCVMSPQDWRDLAELCREALGEQRAIPSALFCSFCGVSKDDVRRLVTGASGNICNVCIELCQEVLDEGVEGEAERMAPRTDHSHGAPVDTLGPAEPTIANLARRVEAHKDDIARLDSRSFETNRRVGEMATSIHALDKTCGETIGRVGALEQRLTNICDGLEGETFPQLARQTERIYRVVEVLDTYRQVIAVTQPWPDSVEGKARTSALFSALDTLLAAESATAEVKPDADPA